MDTRILELAIEALLARRNTIDLQIEQLRSELEGRPGRGTAPAARVTGGVRRQRSEAEKKAQSIAMKRYWAGKRAKAAVPEPAGEAKPKRGPQSSAARRRQSERMKEYWKKRRAEETKEKS